MTQAQDTCQLPIESPVPSSSALAPNEGSAQRYADALPRRDITSSSPGGPAAKSTRSRKRSLAPVAAPRRS